jgi:hypothetical protein
MIRPCLYALSAALYISIPGLTQALAAPFGRVVLIM